MAFLLTPPRFAPAAHHCSPFTCGPSRSSHRQTSRPSFPSFAPFLRQIDNLLGELDREARREAHRQRQQRKRAFRARFDVSENKEGYRIDGEVPGFEQENISIELTDAHTLKVAGDTQNIEQQPPSKSAPAVESGTKEWESDEIVGVTPNELEATGATTPAHSDTNSHKSYQATVEDDFEDLGADSSSTISQSSQAKEPKGKEKVVEESAVVQQQSPANTPVQPQEVEHHKWLSEREHGSFERTFKFHERIDSANVRASLKNGVLSITVPKAPAPEVRRITIQ